jgi:hypothetical protein
LEWALEAAQETVKWSLMLNYPDLKIAYEYVAVHNPAEYGVIRSDIWSSKGSKLPLAEGETCSLWLASSS